MYLGRKEQRINFQSSGEHERIQEFEDLGEKYGRVENIFHRLTRNVKSVTIKERWRCILWEKQQH